MASRHDGRVLVVGAGLIGSHVVDALVQHDIPVTAVTRSEPRGHAADLVSGTDVVVADVSHTDLGPLLDGVSDVVWALGGLMPGEAEQDPELDRRSIFEPLDHLLEALAQRPATTLTMVTSGGTAYGHAEVFPTPETSPARPVNNYGRARVDAERHALASADRNGHGVRILRVANVYGPGQTSGRGQGFLGYALDAAMSGRTFTVFGDGSETRDFVLASDVADVVARTICVPDAPRIMNVASGQPVSLIDALGVVRAVTGQGLAVEFAPRRGFDAPRVELDISRLMSLIDYQATELQDGLAAAWRWLTAAATRATSASSSP